MSSLRAIWGFGWWGRLDTVAHMLHAPQFVQEPLCRKFEDVLNRPCGRPLVLMNATGSSIRNVVYTFTRVKIGRHH